RFDSLDALSYSSEALGLLIRPAASQAELITEGKILHHCVAGYAANHANGKTSIFFIRHISDPEMPFFTLEYKNGKVEQNRGEHNCARTEDVIAFEAEWLNHIRNLKEISI
ncbi:MAG: PcfJ domain-containing protein, partial [Clostridia bacterium]|nr:PcfJ domain-containing protein [Clostridia bacterium]